MRIVGGGRAGRSFAVALRSVGYEVDLRVRGDDLADAAQGVAGVLIATSDSDIAEVAAVIEPGDAVVMHCSGATALTALSPHSKRASVHPLMSLPTPDVGAKKLLSGGWFAIDGDEFAATLVSDLGGQSFTVPDDKRVLYHATAAISANHLVALLGQVERLAALVGVPADAFFELAQGSFDDVLARGAQAALTGPAARNDRATLAAHIASLPDHERPLYDSLLRAAQRLAGQ